MLGSTRERFACAQESVLRWASMGRNEVTHSTVTVWVMSGDCAVTLPDVTYETDSVIVTNLSAS